VNIKLYKVIVGYTENAICWRELTSLGDRSAHKLGEDWLGWMVLLISCHAGCGVCCLCLRAGTWGYIRLDAVWEWGQYFGVTTVCTFVHTEVEDLVLLICLRSVIVSLTVPYSCLQLSICNAYAEHGSLFII
jgi:hypothetical protein